MVTNSNPFDIAEAQVKSNNPFDIAESNFSENLKQPDDSTGNELSSHLARTGFDVLSAIGSIPGEAREFIKHIRGANIQHLNEFGKKFGLPEIKEPKGNDEFESKIQGAWNPVLNALNLFPTYNEIKKSGEEKYPSLKPRNDAEKIGSEIIKDVTLALYPGSGGATKLAKIATAIGANALKHTAMYFGVPEDKADMLKIGGWLIHSMMGNMNARDFGNSQVNEGRQGIGNNAFNPHDLEQDLQRVKRPLLQGDPRSKFAIQAADDISSQIKSGQTNVQDLIERYDAINALKRDKGMFDFNRSDRRVAESRLNKVLHTVRDHVEQHSANPNAYQQWRNGLEALATVNKSEGMTQWVDRLLTKSKYKDLANKAVTGLFTGGGAAAGAGAVLGKSAQLGLGGTGALAATGLYKGGQILYRVLHSPVLAKYYRNAMEAIIRQDSAAFLNNLNRLNNAYENQKPPPFKADQS